MFTLTTSIQECCGGPARATWLWALWSGIDLGSSHGSAICLVALGN